MRYLEPKLAILIDPSKPEGAQKIYSECRRNVDLINKKCEMWVGCTTSPYQKISEWLNLLKDAGFRNRVCYPGRPDHAFSAKYATKLFIPRLLNPYSKRIVKGMVKLGESLAHLLKHTGYYKNNIEFEKNGYLVLYRDYSNVGRKTIRKNAPNITDEESLREIEKLLKREQELGRREVAGIYVEAGSGSDKAVTKRKSLLKDIDKIIGEKTLMAGGGIERDWEIDQLLDAGVDKTIVGTHFEKEPRDIPLFIRKF
jgi:heptaprenylglyceryl phosphate synthase